MDGFKSWAVSVIISALAGTVISIIMPKGSSEKTMRAVIGVFMVSAVCMPLADFKLSDETVASFSFEEYGENNAESLEKYLVAECEDTVGETIKEAAEKFGITEYEVVTDISKGTDGCIIIHAITVEVNEMNDARIRDFEIYLGEKLGVAVTVGKGN